MPVVPILEYPDPLLKQVSAPVTKIDDQIQALITDLTDTLEASPGCVGIAAPQIGALVRMIIVDLTRGSKPQPNQGRLLLLNPVIEWQEGEVIAREGCLSLPHLTANVKRARKIRLRAQNANLDELTIEAEEFEARVILHENDHLDGLLFLDRVASLKTDVFRRKRYAQPAATSKTEGEVGAQ